LSLCLPCTAGESLRRAVKFILDLRCLDWCLCRWINPSSVIAFDLSVNRTMSGGECERLHSLVLEYLSHRLAQRGEVEMACNSKSNNPVHQSIGFRSSRQLSTVRQRRCEVWGNPPAFAVMKITHQPPTSNLYVVDHCYTVYRIRRPVPASARGVHPDTCSRLWCGLTMSGRSHLDPELFKSITPGHSHSTPSLLTTKVHVDYAANPLFSYSVPTGLFFPRREMLPGTHSIISVVTPSFRRRREGLAPCRAAWLRIERRFSLLVFAQ
jgi:hypothetical protein